MSVEYVHQQLGEEVTALAGFYTLLKESRLKHNGREILCITGMCSVESSCCGRRSFYYAIVPGYVVTWKGKKSEAGLPVSEVEPVTDEMTKREIVATIEETDGVLKPNIEFW
ncbi:MAG: hypothetical protein E3J42_00990 [Dehalococcoidia bacterium]|nr:MAG: hypothetical protein E3J42_00990 [Dehalococcoidia bacterium]